MSEEYLLHVVGNDEFIRCRYCSAEYPSNDHPLISPCACYGTRKYIHKSCVEHEQSMLIPGVCSYCKRVYSFSDDNPPVHIAILGLIIFLVFLGLFLILRTPGR